MHRNRGQFVTKLPGMTLVEISIAVVIIGVLVAFGMPRLFKQVERTRASEAFQFLSSLQNAQERHISIHATYAGTLADLDFEQPPPAFFSVGSIFAGGTGDLADSWTLTLARLPHSNGYGPYTVTFTETGYDSTNSTIDGLPDINPLGD